ncbi:MAG: aminopeptidase [Candidatus Woesearchaeota archaeon]
MAEKKSSNEKLQEKVLMKKKSAWLSYPNQEIMKFSEGYKKFLAENKTERYCAEFIVKSLEKSGFKDIFKVKILKSGDKIYKTIKEKCVLAAIVGKDKAQLNLIGSHIDSPRLDLKPNPLYEDSGIAMLKTHYYGGVKKYHWVNLPLALHGIVFTKEGKKVLISIGEKAEEPKFIIPDLLPHLAKKQMEKKGNEIVEGEELNLLVGNIPIDDDKIKEQVKLAVMKELNSKYGLVEEDFFSAELELVPAGMPVDIGLDKSMVGAYGQDDRVCAYTSLQALLDIKSPKRTAVGMFVDKEEIGSYGDTGASSFMLINFVRELASLAGIKEDVFSILEKARSVSADVTGGMDPNFKDVNDPKNASYLGNGVAVEKYGGGGGKYSTHDSGAEYISYIRGILDKNKVPWQTGELGKIDVGGGGTIAMFLSRYGMDCIDAGPCVLGMHAPCEVTSKADIYACYKFYRSFWEN